MSSLGRRAWLWLPPLVYAGGIFFLSSRPVPEAIAPPEGFDKLAHLVLYGGLGGLLARALLGSQRVRGRLAVIAWTTLIGTLYGISDELHQAFVPERSAEVLDAVADMAGSFLGACGWILLAAMWSARVRRREERAGS